MALIVLQAIRELDLKDVVSHHIKATLCLFKSIPGGKQLERALRLLCACSPMGGFVRHSPRFMGRVQGCSRHCQREQRRGAGRKKSIGFVVLDLRLPLVWFIV